MCIANCQRTKKLKGFLIECHLVETGVGEMKHYLNQTLIVWKWSWDLVLNVDFFIFFLAKTSESLWTLYKPWEKADVFLHFFLLHKIFKIPSFIILELKTSWLGAVRVKMLVMYTWDRLGWGYCCPVLNGLGFKLNYFYLKM